MERYPVVDDLLRPILWVAMPRAARLDAPGGTVHVVARCKNREFCFTTPEDFELLLAHLREMRRTSEVPLDAYTLMANHSHLRLQAPTLDALGRPMRWFMTETAKAVHRIRKRRGHFWERRYRAGLVEDDRYALAALRYLDRNPVRAGLVADPAPYPWSSCAAYALGTPTPLITFPPELPRPPPVPQGGAPPVPDPARAECRSPGRRPRSPLDHPARRGRRRPVGRLAYGSWRT